jgi:hypothetical protein
VCTLKLGSYFALAYSYQVRYRYRYLVHYEQYCTWYIHRRDQVLGATTVRTWSEIKRDTSTRTSVQYVRRILQYLLEHSLLPSCLLGRLSRKRPFRENCQTANLQESGGSQKGRHTFLQVSHTHKKKTFDHDHYHQNDFSQQENS